MSALPRKASAAAAAANKDMTAASLLRLMASTITSHSLPSSVLLSSLRSQPSFAPRDRELDKNDDDAVLSAFEQEIQDQHGEMLLQSDS